MTKEEFQEYLDSLPPEIQVAVANALKPLRDYAARATEVRERMADEFPKLNPPLRAVLSLALARYR